MNKKKAIWIIILFLLTVYCVNAIEIINESIGDFKYVENNKQVLNSTAPQYHITYKDKENATYTIIIQEYSLNATDEFNFETENNVLDVWVKRSPGSLSYGDNIVYLRENNKDIFWASKNHVIIIKSKLPKFRNSNDYIQYNENKSNREFSDEIINAYLTIYPDECDQEGCAQVSNHPVTYLFDDPPDLFKKWSSYATTTYFCPEDMTIDAIKSKIIDRELDYLTASDYEIMLSQCKQDHYIFVVHTKEIEPWLEECMTSLAELLDNNSVKVLNGFDDSFIQECYIRAYFKERYNANTVADYNDALFQQLYEKQDTAFMDLIRKRVSDIMAKDPATYSSVDDAENDGIVNQTKTYSTELQGYLELKNEQQESYKEKMQTGKERIPEKDEETTQQFSNEESKNENVIVKIVNFFKNILKIK